MSDNQVKEKDLSKVSGGEETAQHKYAVGFSYDSGLLWSGMPNHHITITVKELLEPVNGEFYYRVEYFEEAYGCTPRRMTLDKPESYLDARCHDK